MVAVKIANMKSGARTDLPPIGGRSNGEVAASQAQAAQLLNVSRRSVQRAHIVHSKGVPELQQLYFRRSALCSAARLSMAARMARP